MRIWWQSSTAVGTDPLWKPYEEALKKHIQKVARPDTIVDIRGVAHMSPLVAGSRYGQYLNDGEAINNAILAEREGYDVFCAACTADPGYLGIKDATNIPAAFLFEHCVHLACILADKFSLLAVNNLMLLQHKESIRRYGLEQQFVPCDASNLRLEDLPGGFSNPEPIVAVVKQQARRAIDEGAGILMPGCNVLNMVLVNCGLSEIDGVPILDIAGAMVKISELMVDLKRIGIFRSRAGLYANLSSKENLASLRKTYGLE